MTTIYKEWMELPAHCAFEEEGWSLEERFLCSPINGDSAQLVIVHKDDDDYGPKGIETIYIIPDFLQKLCSVAREKGVSEGKQIAFAKLVTSIDSLKVETV